MKKTLLLLILIMTVHSIWAALQCFQQTITGTSAPTAKVECPVNTQFCSKEVAKQGGQDMITRACGGLSCQHEGCYTLATGSTMCCCKTDLCNGGIRNSSYSTALLIALALLIIAGSSLLA